MQAIRVKKRRTCAAVARILMFVRRDTSNWDQLGASNRMGGNAAVLGLYKVLSSCMEEWRGDNHEAIVK